LGTLIGALLGFSFTLFGALPWNYILAVLAAVIVCGLLGLRSSSRLAGVTITIVMLVQRGGSHWTIALDRVMEVFLGIVVALAISTLVFPDRARLRLRDGLAQEFLVLGAFFEGILEGFRGAPAEKLPALRKDVLAVLRSNNLLLEASRNEPSGGPGWREGLAMLAQFGRSLFDALVALEFSVKDSHEDGYAQQLEPALGRLAVDIRTGFHYVAECIHAGAFTFRRRACIWRTTLLNWKRAWPRCGHRLPVSAGRDSARLCGAAPSETNRPASARIARGDQPGHRRGAEVRRLAGRRGEDQTVSSSV
jgi:hypothetical protein